MESKFANDPNMKDAMQFAEALSKYPEEVTLGVGLVIVNFINGCSWAFVPDSNKEYPRYLESIQKNPQMSSTKIKNGYLYNINMDYLIQILRRTAGGYVTVRDLELATEHRNQALMSLEKFMKSGKSGMIGIYCLNDSTSITIDGIRYPAFSVTLNDLLAMCVRNGYSVKLGGKNRTPNEVSAHAREVLSRLMMSPSGNALMIGISKSR